jgi:hypothetical protein
MSVSVLQYQKFCMIPTGSTLNEYNFKIAELNKWDVSGKTATDVKKMVDAWIEKLVMSKRVHKYIRLGKTWYKVDRELYTLEFLQWINVDRHMTDIEKEKIHENIHLLIAIFLRPCRFYKFFPKGFDEKRLVATSKLVQDKMDISVALEMIGFFLTYMQSFLMNTKKEYLEKLDREAWRVMKE